MIFKKGIIITMSKNAMVIPLYHLHKSIVFYLFLWLKSVVLTIGVMSTTQRFMKWQKNV